MGQAQVKVQYGDKIMSDVLIVADIKDQPAILGRNWLESIQPELENQCSKLHQLRMIHFKEVPNMDCLKFNENIRQFSSQVLEPQS